MIRIEALLSARLLLQPQLFGNRIYFISDLNGALSLYVMKYGGSLPIPLLPPNISLQNPKLLTGSPYCVFPGLKKILVMVDSDGDENYQPMTIPLEGGFPQPIFENYFANYRVNLYECDTEQNILYLGAESKSYPIQTSYQGNLENGILQNMGQSAWGLYPRGSNSDHSKVILTEEYTIGDHVLYLWEPGDQPRLLYGTPLEDREAEQDVPLNAITHPHFIKADQGLIFKTALFSDSFGIGYLPLDHPQSVQEVAIRGTTHAGRGELKSVHHLEENRFRLEYNIDGSTWMYEGAFNENQLAMELDTHLAGEKRLSSGVIESIHYDQDSDSYILSFSTAVTPIQIFTLETDRKSLVSHTSERVLGLQDDWLQPGEDASFTSFDGTEVPARIYFPAQALAFDGPRPLVYYVHGGPQSQERPDFSWFSMALIQFLTMNGMAVFVPNVRGSTGYGLNYARQVDRDWGGRDRLDHVHAMTNVLPQDDRLDISRAGVVGRSYGGFMSLTLASRHSDLWSAAVNMFGPYDLVSFINRIPATWRPNFEMSVGNPKNEKERAQLVEMSPKTYIDQIQCPLLVIQGANDPRVIAQESQDLVDHLKANDKEVDYLQFENEGHDILKFQNRVSCYNAITAFFIQHLQP